MAEKVPSIYIVGGLPRTGKTTVAERLSHDLRIGSIETDHIRTLFIPTVTSKISSCSGADIKLVTKKLRPRLESLIESLIESESHFVLNGECIDPYMITQSPHRDHIVSCFMGLDNPDQAYDRIRDNAKGKDWTLRIADEDLKQILEKYAVRSKALGETCLQLDLPYIDASQNFMVAQKLAYDALREHTILMRKT